MLKNAEKFANSDLKIADKILQRRLQMMVHSYLYYDLDTTLVSDFTFNRWGQELVQLQLDYPDISENVEYAADFKDWDASTGFDLPRTKRIQDIGDRLLNYHEKQKIPKGSLFAPRARVLPTASAKHDSKSKTISVRKSLF